MILMMLSVCCPWIGEVIQLIWAELLSLSLHVQLRPPEGLSMEEAYSASASDNSYVENPGFPGND